jgi:hypothetical protein
VECRGQHRVEPCGHSAEEADRSINVGRKCTGREEARRWRVRASRLGGDGTRSAADLAAEQRASEPSPSDTRSLSSMLPVGCQ